jgi:hypothetical protein
MGMIMFHRTEREAGARVCCEKPGTHQHAKKLNCDVSQTPMESHLNCGSHRTTDWKDELRLIVADESGALGCAGTGVYVAGCAAPWTNFAYRRNGSISLIVTRSS